MTTRMNTVLFVNATIGFSEKLFPVFFIGCQYNFTVSTSLQFSYPWRIARKQA